MNLLVFFIIMVSGILILPLMVSVVMEFIGIMCDSDDDVKEEE